MDKQEMSAQEYYGIQRVESLARQNAQQALRIADLEAQIAVLQAQQRSAEPAPEDKVLEH